MALDKYYLDLFVHVIEGIIYCLNAKYLVV